MLRRRTLSRNDLIVVLRCPSVSEKVKKPTFYLLFNVLKIGQPQPLSLFIFVVFKHKFYRKTVGFEFGSLE